jgi:hypothetical protein
MSANSVSICHQAQRQPPETQKAGAAARRFLGLPRRVERQDTADLSWIYTPDLIAASPLVHRIDNWVDFRPIPDQMVNAD